MAREGLWLEGRVLQLQWADGGGTFQGAVWARPTSGGSRQWLPNLSESSGLHPLSAGNSLINLVRRRLLN